MKLKQLKRSRTFQETSATAAGFHLLETAVAVSIIVGVAGWGVSGGQRLVAEHRLQAARQAVASAAVAARCLSVSRHTDVALKVRGLTGEFALAPPEQPPSRWTALPAGVRFTSVPNRSVTFHSRGTAAPAGTIRIANDHGEIRIVVSVSGRIRWVRE